MGFKRMELFKKSAFAIGRLLIVGALGGTFLFGMFGVVYLQLKGEEVKIPRVVGKNYNDGVDELALQGLRIRKIASRYSEEKPNTILEQRPRAGTTAKTGLMISVVVSQPNPDGTEAPAAVKDDDEVIEEIEELPELKTEKAKKKSKSKSKNAGAKTRDVIEDTPDTSGSDSPGTDSPPAGDASGVPKTTNPKSTGDQKPGVDKKPDSKSEKPAPKDAKPEKSKSVGDTRPRISPEKQLK